MILLMIIIAILHRFRTNSMLAYVCLCNCCCEFGLCQWATHARDVPQYDREMRDVTSVGIQSQLLGLLSYLFLFRNTGLSMYCAADVNSASWQPTSRQNRRPVAADDTGIARKRRATATQCGYVLTRVRLGNGQTPLSALPGSCRHDVW